METFIQALGTLGTLIICASVLPQVIKTYQTKKCSDLSIVYLGALMLGMALLETYCLYVKDFVFLLGNTLSMASTGTLIFFWFRYGGLQTERR
jgi:uncharacterized protein with PQ loop repeat